MDVKLVSTPKTFYIKERDAFYDDWFLSFWREFFQNSVDAGAKDILINMSEESGRGAFGEIGDSEKKITRIVFADNGCGMTQEILDKVYFAIGQTTKEDGNSVGGYGRARLMTCFSQDRYSILTKDRFVLGNGPNYVNYSLEEAEAALSDAIDKMDGLLTDGMPMMSLITSKASLESDLSMVRGAIAQGGYKGCRVEVDIDQKPSVSWSSAPTPEIMGTKLKEYLSESQLPPNVTINDESPESYFNSEKKLQARKGQVKRVLSADIDGELVEFANIHVSESGNALHKGQMIVRVDGASMYKTGLELPETQIILEIKKDLSRQVLTSNRDGMRREYRRVVDAFVAELNMDNTSALADKASKENFLIQGDKGQIYARVPDLNAITVDRVTEEEAIEAFRDISEKAVKAQTIEALNAHGVTEDIVEEIVRQTYRGNSIVSQMRWTPDFPLKADIEKFVEAVNEKYYDDKPVDIFIENASDPLKNWVLKTVEARTEKALIEAKEENLTRLKDMNDVHVSIVSTNDKTKGAIRRNDPRKWDVETGKGRVPRALLASWTAACSVAVETLMKHRPATGSFSWTTGWVYSVPEQIDEGDRWRSSSVEAMCRKDDNGFKFLLNPIRDDGTLRYSINDPKDRQRLIGLALHEVTHVLVGYHNEAFAGTMTDLMMEVDIAEANKRMKESVRGVLAAYDSGKSRVQAMDDEPGPRPAERLLQIASGNDLASDYGYKFQHEEDGTYSVDNDEYKAETELCPSQEEDMSAWRR